MKPLNQASGTLTLHHRRWGIGFLGLLMIPVGVSILFSEVAAKVTLSCSRVPQQLTQAQCVSVETSLRGKSQQNLPLAQIRGADIVQVGSGRGGPVYRIYLTTDQQQIKVLSNGSLNDLQGKVEQIQEFLISPSKTHLKIQEDYRSLLYPISLVLTAIGGIMGLALFCTTTLRLNKITGQLKLNQHYPGGVKTIQYPLNQITNIVVGSTGKASFVVVVLNEGVLPKQVGEVSLQDLVGKKFGILFCDLGLWFGGRAQCHKLAQRLLDFLND